MKSHLITSFEIGLSVGTTESSLTQPGDIIKANLPFFAPLCHPWFWY